MRIEYDPEVDIITFYLAERERWEYGNEVVPGAILALDEKDAPVALEVHDARQRYGEDFVKRYDIYAYRPLAEIAAQYGVAPTYLRSLAVKGKLKAKKEDGRWLTTPAWIEDCLADVKAAS